MKSRGRQLMTRGLPLLLFLSVAMGLGSSTSVWGKDKELDAAVRAKDVAAFIERAEQFCKDDPKKAAQEIPTAYAKLDESFGLSDEARYALFANTIRVLLSIKGHTAMGELIETFKKRREWRERFLILHVAWQNAVLQPVALALMALEDDAPLVVSTAARILGNSKSVRPLDPLVAAMGRWETQARREKAATKGRKGFDGDTAGKAWLACRDALEKLTGKSFHYSGDYRNYIAAHRDSIDPNNVKLDDKSKDKTAVGLFGLDVTGKNIVFVLDISGSMEATDPPSEEQLAKLRGRTVVPGEADKALDELMESRRRIVRAKKELTAVVQSLGDDKSFNLVIYSTDVTVWKKRTVTADEDNKSDAVAFIENLKANGITVTDDALDAAFVDPNVDTVYLITDGAPTHEGAVGRDLPPDAVYLMKQISRTLKMRNYLRQVRLFTLGFREAKEEWLKGLANDNFGRYQRID